MFFAGVSGGQCRTRAGRRAWARATVGCRGRARGQVRHPTGQDHVEPVKGVKSESHAPSTVRDAEEA